MSNANANVNANDIELGEHLAPNTTHAVIYKQKDNVHPKRKQNTKNTKPPPPVLNPPLRFQDFGAARRKILREPTAKIHEKLENVTFMMISVHFAYHGTKFPPLRFQDSRNGPPREPGRK